MRKIKGKREILSEKGKEVYHTLMALTKSRAQALSPVSVTVETGTDISTSPGESKSPPGENEGREIRKPKKQSISSHVPFFSQTEESKDDED